MTFEELQDVLSEQFGCDMSEIAEDTELEELGADHEDMIELAWEVGEATGIEVGEDQVERCATVGQLWNLIRDLEEEL